MSNSGITSYEMSNPGCRGEGKEVTLPCLALLVPRALPFAFRSCGARAAQNCWQFDFEGRALRGDQEMVVLNLTFF